MAEDAAAIEDKAPDGDMNIVSGLLVAHVEEVRNHIDEEHNAWTLKMWCRMDRDGNGFINRAELDCEEFRGIIRSVLAPEMGAVMGGVEYMRSELNMSQAINYCLSSLASKEKQTSTVTMSSLSPNSTASSVFSRTKI
ncbi:unnamed protein product [Symbiodinium sp. CCMP2456]|nr:unnamed protein product [Symbiodinium sp. CCMP2456]